MKNKRITDSKTRLREMMEHYHLNQTDLCKKTGLQKSALSNYLNGERLPRQDQISLIVDPFGINPSWFMGYDAPMFMSDVLQAQRPDEVELLEKYNSLNADGQEKVRGYVSDLAGNVQYKKDTTGVKEKTG